MSCCIFPGSFDPVTCGHMDLITRAAKLFDRVTVTVMVNRAKQDCIPREERVRMLEWACADLPNVQVDCWEGLLADYVRLRPGTVVLRGVRTTAEFEQERTAASVNRRLNPEMETLLLPAGDGLGDVSSSAVREIAAFGGDYRDMVPESVYDEISRWLKASGK